MMNNLLKRSLGLAALILMLGLGVTNTIDAESNLSNQSGMLQMACGNQLASEVLGTASSGGAQLVPEIRAAAANVLSSNWIPRVTSISAGSDAISRLDLELIAADGPNAECRSAAVTPLTSIYVFAGDPSVMNIGIGRSLEMGIAASTAAVRLCSESLLLGTPTEQIERVASIVSGNTVDVACAGTSIQFDGSNESVRISAGQFLRGMLSSQLASIAFGGRTPRDRSAICATLADWASNGATPELRRAASEGYLNGTGEIGELNQFECLPSPSDQISPRSISGMLAQIGDSGNSAEFQEAAIDVLARLLAQDESLSNSNLLSSAASASNEHESLAYSLGLGIRWSSSVAIGSAGNPASDATDLIKHATDLTGSPLASASTLALGRFWYGFDRPLLSTFSILSDGVARFGGLNDGLVLR